MPQESLSTIPELSHLVTPKARESYLLQTSGTAGVLIENYVEKNQRDSLQTYMMVRTINQLGMVISALPVDEQPGKINYEDWQGIGIELTEQLAQALPQPAQAGEKPDMGVLLALPEFSNLNTPQARETFINKTGLSAGKMLETHEQTPLTTSSLYELVKQLNELTAVIRNLPEGETPNEMSRSEWEQLSSELQQQVADILRDKAATARKLNHLPASKPPTVEVIPAPPPPPTFKDEPEFIAPPPPPEFSPPPDFKDEPDFVAPPPTPAAPEPSTFAKTPRPAEKPSPAKEGTRVVSAEGVILTPLVINGPGNWQGDIAQRCVNPKAQEQARNQFRNLLFVNNPPDDKVAAVRREQIVSDRQNLRRLVRLIGISYSAENDAIIANSLALLNQGETKLFSAHQLKDAFAHLRFLVENKVGNDILPREPKDQLSHQILQKLLKQLPGEAVSSKDGGLIEMVINAHLPAYKTTNSHERATLHLGQLLESLYQNSEVTSKYRLRDLVTRFSKR